MDNGDIMFNCTLLENSTDKYNVHSGIAYIANEKRTGYERDVLLRSQFKIVKVTNLHNLYACMFIFVC